MNHGPPSRRILLVEPPFLRLFKDSYSLDRLPLWLGYLGGVVQRDTGWECRLYNSDFHGPSEQLCTRYLTGQGFRNYLARLQDVSAPVWREVAATIAGFQPAVVGIAAKAQNFEAALNVARIAKQLDPGIVTIAGGPHPTVQASEVLGSGVFDVVVLGEGEATLVDLLHALEGGRSLAQVSGIAYHEDGRIAVNSPRPFLAALDDLPYPHACAADILTDFQRYPLSAFRHVMATRGCPHNCFFCGSRTLWGRAVRFRSPMGVVHELQALQGLGLRSVHFSDDTFGVNARYLRELCAALKRHCPALQWSCETHVSLIDEESAALMRAAGCQSIEIGIESGSNTLLERMRKGGTVEQALRACEVIHGNGMEVVGLFMVGFPDETRKTLQETFRAMRAARCDRIHYSIFTPYPGTEAYEACRSRGLIGPDFEPARFGHQSPLNCFSSHLTLAELRAQAARMERLVDRRNTCGRIRRLFTRSSLRRTGELGWRGSLVKVGRFFGARPASSWRLPPKDRAGHAPCPCLLTEKPAGPGFVPPAVAPQPFSGSVAAVVVNLNGGERILRCLHALTRQDRPPDRIIVVDNGSSDGSPDAIRRALPQVEILEMGTNLGITVARNRGLRHAAADFVLLLDNDVYLAEDCLRRLLASHAAHRPALVCPRVVLYPETHIVQCDGAAPHFVGTLALRHAYRPAARLTARTVPVNGLIGACMLAARKDLLSAGGFDENYFFYFEDLELSLRLRGRGAEILCVPTAVVYHDRGPGTPGLSFRGQGAYPLRRAYLTMRNRWYTILIHYQRRTLLLLAPVLALYELAVLGVALYRGWGTAWWRAWRWQACHQRGIRHRRREIQEGRRLPDSAILTGGSLPLAPGFLRGKRAGRTAAVFSAILDRYFRLVCRILK